MGYWSNHPMSGDTPMDYIDEIDGVLEKKEGIKGYLFELENEDYRSIWERNLADIVAMFETGEKLGFKEGAFVVPFKIAEFRIVVKDKELSEKIKRMILDGNALSRGYEIPVPTNSDYPKAPNWNNFESPYDYAVQLHDLWDDLMAEKISFDSLGQSKGLLETMLTKGSMV